MIRVHLAAALLGSITLFASGTPIAYAEGFPRPGQGMLPDCDSSRAQPACPGTGAGSDGPPSLPGTAVAIDGVCGPAANGTETSQPTGSSACSAGDFQNRPDSSSEWRWDCEGASGGSNAFCTADKPAPPTVSLGASPESIEDGESARLSWSVSGATSCSRSGTWSGSLAPSSGSADSGPLSAEQTYRYTLSCENAVGVTDTDSVDVIVSNPVPPPTLTLSADRSSVTEGGAVDLSWTSTNATSCDASVSWNGPTASPGGPAPQNGFSGSKPVNGSHNWSPASKDYGASGVTFRMVCRNTEGNEVQGSVSVVVTDAPEQEPIDAELTAASTTLEPGASTALSWTSKNAGRCEIDGVSEQLTNGRVDGSLTVSPPTTTTYTLRCYGDIDTSETATDSVEIDVTAGPVQILSWSGLRVADHASEQRFDYRVRGEISWCRVDYQGIRPPASKVLMRDKSYPSQHAGSFNQVVYNRHGGAPRPFTAVLKCRGADGTTVTKSASFHVNPDDVNIIQDPTRNENNMKRAEGYVRSARKCEYRENGVDSRFGFLGMAGANTTFVVTIFVETNYQHQAQLRCYNELMRQDGTRYNSPYTWGKSVHVPSL